MAAAQTAAEGFTLASVGAGLAAAGIDPWLLFFASLGAGMFVLFASSIGRWRSLACAACALPLGPIIGHAVGVRYFASDGDAMKLAAFVATPVLVLLVRGLITMLEARSAGLWGSVADRVTGKGGRP